MVIHGCCGMIKVQILWEYLLDLKIETHFAAVAVYNYLKVI
jgi:hypothetical protein